MLIIVFLLYTNYTIHLFVLIIQVIRVPDNLNYDSNEYGHGVTHYPEIYSIWA
jgi:hypothetical protein